MINNLGATTEMELVIVACHSIRFLKEESFTMARIYARAEKIEAEGIERQRSYAALESHQQGSTDAFDHPTGPLRKRPSPDRQGIQWQLLEHLAEDVDPEDRVPAPGPDDSLPKKVSMFSRNNLPGGHL